MNYYIARSYYNLYTKTKNKSYLEGIINLLADSNSMRERYLLYKAYLALEEFDLANQVFINLPESYRELIRAINIEETSEKLKSLLELLDERIEIFDYYIELINTILIENKTEYLDKVKEAAINNLLDDEKSWVEQFINVLYKFRDLYDGVMIEILLDKDLSIEEIKTVIVEDWVKMFLSISIYKTNEKYKILLPKNRELYEIGLELLYSNNKINKNLFEVLLNV